MISTSYWNVRDLLAALRPAFGRTFNKTNFIIKRSRYCYKGEAVDTRQSACYLEPIVDPATVGL